MEKLEYDGINIVFLYLNKLESLTDRERRVLIDAIELINKPMFVTVWPPKRVESG